MSIYSCSLCGYNTKTKGNINKHVKETIKCKGADINIEEVEVVCKICNKTFENDIYLKQHIKRCFEKKAVPVNNYENAEEFKEKINMLVQLITVQNLKIDGLVKSNEELRREVNDLTRRIEKLEFVKPKYEPLTQEELDAGDSCNYCEKIQFKPTSRKHFEDMHRMNEIKVDNGDSVEVVLNGETIETTGYLYEDHILLDSGPAYYFDKAEVTRSDLKHISKLKVMMRKICKNNSTCKREGIFYCEEHAI